MSVLWPSQPTVLSVHLKKLPTFCPEDQEIWWVAANMALTSQAITDDESKFNQFVAQLTYSATRLRPDLEPTATNQCATHKSAIISTFTILAAQPTP